MIQHIQLYSDLFHFLKGLHHFQAECDERVYIYFLHALWTILGEEQCIQSGFYCDRVIEAFRDGNNLTHVMAIMTLTRSPLLFIIPMVYISNFPTLTIHTYIKVTPYISLEEALQNTVASRSDIWGTVSGRNLLFVSTTDHMYRTKTTFYDIIEYDMCCNMRIVNILYIVPTHATAFQILAEDGYIHSYLCKDMPKLYASKCDFSVIIYAYCKVTDSFVPVKNSVKITEKNAQKIDTFTVNVNVICLDDIYIMEALNCSHGNILHDYLIVDHIVACTPKIIVSPENPNIVEKEAKNALWEKLCPLVNTSGVIVLLCEKVVEDEVFLYSKLFDESPTIKHITLPQSNDAMISNVHSARVYILPPYIGCGIDDTETVRCDIEAALFNVLFYGTEVYKVFVYLPNRSECIKLLNKVNRYVGPHERIRSMVFEYSPTIDITARQSVSVNMYPLSHTEKEIWTTTYDTGDFHHIYKSIYHVDLVVAYGDSMVAADIDTSVFTHVFLNVSPSYDLMSTEVALRAFTNINRPGLHVYASIKLHEDWYTYATHKGYGYHPWLSDDLEPDRGDLPSYLPPHQETALARLSTSKNLICNHQTATAYLVNMLHDVWGKDTLVLYGHICLYLDKEYISKEEQVKLYTCVPQEVYSCANADISEESSQKVSCQLSLEPIHTAMHCTQMALSSTNRSRDQKEMLYKQGVNDGNFTELFGFI